MDRVQSNPSSRFKEIWFRGLSKEDKEKLQNALANSIMADRLREILSEWSRELPSRKVDYDSPSWSHRQAHLNGMSEILERLNSILDLKE